MKILFVLFILCSSHITQAQPVADGIKHPRGTKDTFICMLAEVPPQYPGGQQALLRFIGSHLHIPDSLEDFQGRIIAGFDVEADGSISNITIRRSPHPAFDPIMIHMLRKMPRWQPGRISGKPTKAQYILPVTVCPAE